MKDVVQKALVHWGIEDAEFSLVAARENAVYKVARETGDIALRLHRKGYRSDAELSSELAWMAKVADAGISTAAPIPALNGNFVLSIEGIQVDALTWLNGRPMAEVVERLPPDGLSQLFFDLGREMAKLHLISDDWKLPKGFDRVHWNVEGLLGEAPHWDKFWENPQLTKQDQELFCAFRNAAIERLIKLEDKEDYGLIHADLVSNNVLVENGQIKLIDFDDGGFGYRQFDIATALLKLEEAEDFISLKNNLIAGYQSERAIDVSMLDLFLALRAVTYLGWNITRMTEQDGVTRNKRFLDTSKKHVVRFLSELGE